MGRIVKLTSAHIETWVARHFEYKRRKNGDELLICNPFDGDTGFKFNISTQPKESKKTRVVGFWVHDWRPSASSNNGSFIKFVQKYKGLTFREAVKDICGENVDIRSLLPGGYTAPQREEKPELITKLPDNAVPIQDPTYQTIQAIALQYLAGRCINAKDAEAYKIHYTPSMIVFPYLEYDSVVYWQGRTYSKLNKKFLFPDKSAKTDYLYGFDNAEPGQPVTIVEAIFCALTVGPGGLAIGGASMAETQRRKLRAINPSIVILAPDNDKEGMASAYKNFMLLRDYYEVWLVFPPDPHKDWNDMASSYEDKQAGVDAVREFISTNAKPMTLFQALKFKNLSKPGGHDFLTLERLP